MIMLSVLSAVVLLAAGVLLFLLAGLAGFAGISVSTASIPIVGIMLAIIIVGYLLGIVPTVAYAKGFRNGYNTLLKTEKNNSEAVWTAVLKLEKLFRQNEMDAQFTEYRATVVQQYKKHQLLKDISNCFNEENLRNRTWQPVMCAIPLTLLGLGLLGTLISFAAGSTLDNLTDGSLYSLGAGLILAILFRQVTIFCWAFCLKEQARFVARFHKSVVPSAEEQVHYRERVEARQILSRLDRIPKNAAFSVSNASSGSAGSDNLSEKILMPRIQTSLRNEEFTFFLQAKYALTSEQISGAEALVRWKHPKLGTIQPSTFIPMLEANGYITKLDQYIWEKVCMTLRGWLDEGKTNITISINVSKTDILAMDVAGFLLQMVQKYHLPPNRLSVEIAENAYILAKEETVATQVQLRQNGVAVVVDGFDGNFMWIQEVEGFGVDALKLDLRQMEDYRKANDIFEQAKSMNLTLCVEGIENMEQLAMLLRNGCTEGQGYYFSKPMEVEDFEKALQKETAL